jgi:hypothetical protein
MGAAEDRSTTKAKGDFWLLSCEPMYWDVLVEIIRWNANAANWENRVIIYEPCGNRWCA